VLHIVRVLAPNPSVYTLEGTNTWIVGRDPAIVIDPGPDISSHLDDVARVAGRVASVLVTHDHEDHAPGAVGFATRVGAPLFAFRLDGAERLRNGQRFTAADDLEIVAVTTPGHSSDHVAFLATSDRALFTGDAVVGRGTSFIDPPDGDLIQYLRSLRRMQELRPRTIYPGHGPVVFDARGKLAEYIAHREDRERQILAVLAEGPRSIGEVVATIYFDHPREVHPLAARSVLAHLLKLETEGRAEHKGAGEATVWSVREPRTCARCGRSVNGRARLCGPCSLAVLQDTADGDPAAADRD
jgi:glyoxylase-like metal-dependent hydrolase (beta-lactamase superfamily II)